MGQIHFILKKLQDTTNTKECDQVNVSNLLLRDAHTHSQD